MNRKQRQRARQQQTATIERVANNVYGPMGIQGSPYGGRAGRNITIPANVLMTMLQNMAPQGNQAQDFAPGSPLQPYQGVVPKFGPRQWSYPVGWNLQAGTDRTLGSPDIPSFAQLRQFALLYEGIALCERVILDMIPKLEPKVVLKESAVKRGADENDHTASIKRWTTFLEKPSLGQGLDIHSWMRMAYTEQTQIDALAIFKRQSRGGQLFGLEIIDGASIKPLLDERGMIPQPPFPCYQQYPYGVPGDMYTTQQMIYYRESPRANTPYGLSRIERIITRVNQALRKEQKDLARFTEGNLPAGIMEVPDTSMWTPDQIDAYEQAWNALMAGNAQQQVRVKFTQPGMKYTEFADYINSQHLTEFDQFLLNVAVAVYGLSMGDLGFTGDIHKSSGDSQQNMMYRRTLEPLVAVYCRMLTTQLCEAFGDDDLEVVMVGFTEVEDLQTQAAAYTQFATIGAISPSGVAKLMNFPEIPETGPLLQNPKIGITPLSNYEVGSDFRNASDAAQLAGMQLAAQAPQQAQQGTDATQGNEATHSTGIAKTPQKAAPTTPQGKTNAPDSDAPTKADIKRLMAQVEELLRMQRGGVQRSDSGKPPETVTHHTGMMLAFLLDDATAQQLALPDGEPASDLHVTLGFMGSVEDFRGDIEHLKSTVATFASQARPLSGKVSGIGRFTPSESSDGQSPIYASVDVKGLHALREALVQYLVPSGYAVANDFAYCPHITLCYVDEDVPTPITSVPTLPLTFDTLCLAIGDDQYFFRLGEPYEPTTPHNSERTPRDATPIGRGDSEVAPREASTRVAQSVASRAGLHTAIDERIDTLKQWRIDDENTEQTAHQAMRTTGNTQPTSTHTHASDSASREAKEDYKRWRSRAIDDVKNGRSQRDFSTISIPQATHTTISAGLARCSTPDEVRTVFQRAQQAPLDSEMIGAQPLLEYDAQKNIWQPDDVQAQLDALRARGTTYLQWNTHVSQTGACPLCEMNDGQVVEIGTPFKSQHVLPQAHVNCQCSISEFMEKPVQRAAQPSMPMISKMGACTCEVCTERNGKPVQDGKHPPFHDGCQCEMEDALRLP